MRRVALGIIAVCMGVIASLMTLPTASAVSTNPAVFLVPHQDDEVLTFGAAVKQHLLAGRDVILVLLTDGSSSGECDNLRTGTYGHPDFDQTDGITGNYTSSPVDRAACTNFRDNEFLNAAAAMRSNVGTGTGIGTLTTDIRVDRMQDGTLTKTYVRSVIDSYDAIYGTPSFKAMTYKECSSAHPCGLGDGWPGHADHDATGEALRDFNDQVAGADARFYIKPELWPSYTTLGTFNRELFNTSLNSYRWFGQWSVSGAFCEQYGGATLKDRDTLDNGRVCPKPVFNSGGSDSKVHLPGL